MPSLLLQKCKVRTRGLCNLQVVFCVWPGHLVKLLQHKVAQAVSPAASHPLLTPEQLVFLLTASSAKWSSSETLMDGPVMIPTGTYLKSFTKGVSLKIHFLGPLAGSPHSDWCPREAAGSVQRCSATVLPSNRRSSHWCSHLRSGMLERENKTPLPSLPSFQREAKKRKVPVGLGASTSPMFLSN